MEEMNLKLIKLLYMRFTSIYGDKFNRNHSSDEFVRIWWEEWLDGLIGISPYSIKDALTYCKINLDWPPSIAEFRRICQKASGIPTAEECLQAAIRKDFSHVITKNIYDKIGSWAMQHDSEKELLRKFKDHYQDELTEYKRPNQIENKPNLKLIDKEVA